MSIKKTLTMCALSFAAIAVWTSTVHAEANSPVRQPRMQRDGQHRMQMNRPGRISEMAEQLNLTEDQKKIINPILENQGKMVQKIMRDPNMTPQDKRVKVQELQKQSEDAINKHLTPEQQAKLAELKKKPPVPTRPGQEAGAGLGAMAEKLGLTEEQKTALKPIMETQIQQAQAIRQDSSLSPEQKQAKLKDLREQNQEEISKILTPEQQEKMKQMRQNMRNRPGMMKRAQGKVAEPNSTK
jgi:Spy/CpxP family protein refolding chaperone